MFQLYQFKFSHYCEKVRWALDHKGVAYVPRNLLPGFHMSVTRKLAPRTSVPILVDEGRVVQDSTEIINFLDQNFPDRRLTPEDPQKANEALEWEEYLDQEIGVTLRLWFYYHTLPDRDRALRFLLDGVPWHQRALFALAFPRVRLAMMTFMEINAESAKRAEKRFLTALDRLENALDEHPYLVGHSFSRADLTACALLSPFCRPGDPDERGEVVFPEHVNALRREQEHRRFYSWVRETYEQHRSPVHLRGTPAVSGR